MFYFFSKILFWLLQPSTVLVLLIYAGTTSVLLRWRERVGRVLLATGVTGAVLLGCVPVSDLAVHILEQRFPQPALPQTATGIIVLGGFEDIELTAAHGQLALSESAERLTEGLLLARKLPRAKLVFTGGEATIVRTGGSAAGAVGEFFKAAGIEDHRLVLETASRTTYENATLLRAQLSPKPDDVYVLVTSAFHMPRSVGTFQQQGFNVLAWPVDYRSKGLPGLSDVSPNPIGGLRQFDLAAKEAAGLIAYWLSGRSRSLWPGPG